MVSFNLQGPRSKFSSGGTKEKCVKEIFFGWGGGGGHASGFLFSFYHSIVPYNQIMITRTVVLIIIITLQVNFFP